MSDEPTPLDDPVSRWAIVDGHVNDWRCVCGWQPPPGSPSQRSFALGIHIHDVHLVAAALENPSAVGQENQE